MKRPSFHWWRERRAHFFTVFLIIIILALELKLFLMQVVQRPAFLQQAAQNRLRADLIEPARGRIYDRNGDLLVDNRPIYTIYALPWTLRKNLESVPLLASTLGLDSLTVVRRASQRGWRTFQPTPILRDVPLDVLARFEAQRLDFPGVSYQLESKRSYPLPQAVHFLGYIGEAPPDPNKKGPPRYGLIGRRGLEKIYDEWLGGTPGIRYLEVDANGRVHGEVADPPPVAAQAGWDLYLNIDADLQRYTYELLAGRDGAVVAMDPRTGGILTLLSEPDYDPDLFAGVMPHGVWKKLQEDPAKPLLNRSIQGLYPPGSTFKMAIMAAGFDEGAITDNLTVGCSGGLQVGNRRFGCWQKRGHGGMNWSQGLQHSCDVFFYTVGLRLGAERMGRFITEFGFGARTGIDLDGEVRGIGPTQKYLDKRYGTGKWSAGLLANISIGQGDVTVTPLQLACFTSAIATGWKAKPKLARGMRNPVSGEVRQIDAELKPLNVSQKALEKIRYAMTLVVNEQGGTAYHQRRPDLIIAGKTGTAQNPHGKDHGLFVGYAPVDDPIIAVAVVVEHGEHGSTAAAPVACGLMERYIYDLYPGPHQPRQGWTPPEVVAADSLHRLGNAASGAPITLDQEEILPGD